ncbi:MAG: energy transducer TonB [Flavobacteriales bacterium]|nr:energy transducer TonB [Flavobacteriales bacterium]
MRSFLILIFSVLQHAASAQDRGVSPYGQRIRTEQDSIRVEETHLLKNDHVVSRKRYVGQRPVGIWQEYDSKGRLTAERDFDKVKYIPVPRADKDTTSSVAHEITQVEEMPMFPGGESELFKFLGKNVRYPGEAQDAGIAGVVYLTGVVDETGTWTTTGIFKGAHPYLDYEAWRVLDLMPRWTPGKIDGVPVRVQYNLPIKFTLL